MPSLTYHKNSPYYLIRYYDKYAEDPRKRRVTISSKIELTPSDKKRIENSNKGEKVKLQGNREINKKLKQLESALVDREIHIRSGLIIKDRLKLSEGLEKFIKEKTLPGDSDALKRRTIENYRLAVKSFIFVSGDKYIETYTKEGDFYDLLGHFELKDYSQTTRSIYTRTLKSLWNYFVEKKFANENIIKVVRDEQKDPEPIPLEEMKVILDYFKRRNQNQYNFIKFMLLTGSRPSTALVQRKEWIDLKQKVMRMYNVKARKQKKYFYFPIYSELYELLETMDTAGEGRLLDVYKVNPDHYTNSLKFYPRAINHLYKAGLISKKYTLKQIRPTFASYAVNELELNLTTVKTLLDHSHVKTTDRHYVKSEIAKIRTKMDKSRFE